MPQLLLTESNTFGNPSAVGSHTAERVQSLFREVINAVLLTLSFCVHVHAYKNSSNVCSTSTIKTQIFRSCSGALCENSHIQYIIWRNYFFLPLLYLFVIKGQQFFMYHFTVPDTFKLTMHEMFLISKINRRHLSLTNCTTLINYCIKIYKPEKIVKPIYSMQLLYHR